MKKTCTFFLVLFFNLIFFTSTSYAASHGKTVDSETDKIIEAMSGEKEEVVTEEKKEEMATEEKKEEMAEVPAKEEKKEEEDEEPDCD